MFAQSPQQIDTVYVVAPMATDTVPVRVASGTVQVTDTLHAVVRQTGGEWYLFATLVLTVALVGVTIWAQRQMHRLQTTNNNLQAEHAKLQREFNQMEAQHEQERREAERQRAEEQRRATDARISGIAFALRRQLISWINEAPKEMRRIVREADEFANLDKQAGGSGGGTALQMPTVPEPGRRGAMQWARERQSHFDRAEERMLQLVSAAPEGTQPVAESLRRVCVLFYQATSRLNRQVAVHNQGAIVEPLELAAAYHEIEQCVIELGTTVGPELLEAEEIMARGDRSTVPET